MALPTMTYYEYLDEGGEAPEEEFAMLLPWALSAVAHEIWPHESVDAAQLDAYRRAVTAAIDADRITGGMHGMLGGSSVSIGSFSMGGSTSGSDSGSGQIVQAIRQALTGSGLLCKVVM